LRLAKNQNEDLVMISDKVDPPICKIVNFKRFLYEQKKKQKQLPAKNNKVVAKIIRFKSTIDIHDLKVRVKKTIEFLKKGIAVKIYVRFLKRTFLFKENEENKGPFKTLHDMLSAYAEIEEIDKKEEKQKMLIVTPKSKKK
jgi:translation initiation factor IF-3